MLQLYYSQVPDHIKIELNVENWKPLATIRPIGERSMGVRIEKSARYYCTLWYCWVGYLGDSQELEILSPILTEILTNFNKYYQVCFGCYPNFEMKHEIYNSDTFRKRNFIFLKVCVIGFPWRHETAHWRLSEKNLNYYISELHIVF